MTFSVCVEWDYGGIPAWLAYKPDIRFRSYNDGWRAYMSAWVARVINETRDFFADRGGPIILAQIENELGSGDEQYTQWSGDLANSFGVGVIWGMCNGQTATNTINTCNANDCTDFITRHGQNGRVLIDQPDHGHATYTNSLILLKLLLLLYIVINTIYTVNMNTNTLTCSTSSLTATLFTI